MYHPTRRELWRHHRRLSSQTSLTTLLRLVSEPSVVTGSTRSSGGSDGPGKQTEGGWIPVSVTGGLNFVGGILVQIL